MSAEGDKRCPLCAEEMDWTDQQFKPCNCGYQVCVWCWHRLIDTAEKDSTEGRCPACRGIYEKAKIAAIMQAADCNKPKTVEAVAPEKTVVKSVAAAKKDDLTAVRVIQRKMAYVTGLPVSLADEDVLRREGYFGQYGKLAKVSLSRTAGGVVQQFVNGTCSVYATYTTEEEAVRCIRAVHGFVLEGKQLKASFGTAKYCHAWLRSTRCGNPECLYLHTMGAEEDSLGKDEAVSVHTRNRVQQLSRASRSTQKRSGNVLPPPIEELAVDRSSASSKGSVKSPATKEKDGKGSVKSSATKEKHLASRDRTSHESCDASHSDVSSSNELRISEDSSDHNTRLHQRTHNEASVPFICAESVQTSAEPDTRNIYRSSNTQNQAQRPPCLAAPPGFPLPRRGAPPGFSTHDRTAISRMMPPPGFNTRPASNHGMGGSYGYPSSMDQRQTYDPSSHRSRSLGYLSSR